MAIRFVDEANRVHEAYRRAERRVLVRAAARGRAIARSAMRRRSRPSRPGEAPTVRKGQLKRFLLFAWDEPRRVAVFGPQKLSGAAGDTPEALEKGLTTVRRVGRKRQARQIKYEKRPAMLPALERIAPDLPAMWSEALRR